LRKPRDPRRVPSPPRRSAFPDGAHRVGLLLLGGCDGGGAATTAGAGKPTSSQATASTGPAVPPEASGGIDVSSLKGRIAFSGGPPHAEDVYVVNADGTDLTRVTSGPAAEFDPSLSPDGRRIAYRHQPGDDLSTDIYTIASDGSGAT
jgi:WD40-like Beta Propeller Repeat